MSFTTGAGVSSATLCCWRDVVFSVDGGVMLLLGFVGDCLGFSTDDAWYLPS